MSLGDTHLGYMFEPFGTCTAVSVVCSQCMASLLHQFKILPGKVVHVLLTNSFVFIVLLILFNFCWK